VTFCRVMMCTQGTHISLNTGVLSFFACFFLTLRVFDSENRALRIFVNGQTVRFYFSLLKCFCPVNRNGEPA
jgi:hypothetical protein